MLYLETVTYPDPETEEKNVEVMNIINEFNDKSTEVSWIVENMNYGQSLEEAKATARENMEYMEAEYGTEAYTQKVLEKSIEKTKYFVGDACPAQDPIPTDYKEITEEQYMNGEY